jgi:hypothetical protein
MCVVTGIGLRQGDLPSFRREHNRSLSRQRPEPVPAVVLDMGIGDLHRQERALVFLCTLPAYLLVASERSAGIENSCPTLV